MKFFPFLFFLIWINSSYGQVNVVTVDISKLPSGINYSGHVAYAVKWNDNLGLNYVVATETGEYNTKDKEGEQVRNAALYVYHYAAKSDSLKLLWRIYDYNKECPFDVSVEFIGKAFNITDLDKNGVAEVWAMYRNYCASDVSPAPTKIIMYEGAKKYAVRGEDKVQVSEKDFAGGQYTLDENFKNGKPFFRQYATNLWEKNKTRK